MPLCKACEHFHSWWEHLRPRGDEPSWDDDKSCRCRLEGWGYKQTEYFRKQMPEGCPLSKGDVLLVKEGPDG
jgi:hypothetical protein